MICDRLEIQFFNQKLFKMKVKKLLAIWSVSLCLGALGIKSNHLQAQTPTDNPVFSFYSVGHDYPAWIGEIKWNNVITMSDQGSGSANFADFKTKRDLLYSQGGGVLYYPAGTYSFEIPDGPNDEGLMLKKGVVIRGERPLADDKAVTVKSKMALATDHGLNAMPTKFVFTTTNSPGGVTIPGQIPKAWNMIGIKKGANESRLSDVSHAGIAWIEMQYGYIYFGMDNFSGWAGTWATSNSWLGTKAVNGWQQRVPNGTHPMDPFHGTRNGLGNDTSSEGEKFFVFGVHLKNCAIPNYMTNKGGSANFACDPESWRFSGKMTLEGRHIFIANNVISKPSASFRMDVTCTGGHKPNGFVFSGRFDYGYGVGIDVNKGLGSAFKNRTYIKNPIPSIYYSEDVIIQDNVIYNHGNKSIEAAGKYLIIKGNVMPRDYLAHTDDPYGIGSPGVGYNSSNGRCWTGESVDDMMSRTMDLGGWMTWVDDNYGKYTGTSYANDGEGILYQRHNGIETYGVAITNNHLVDGYLAPYDVHAVGVLHAFNEQNGAIGIVKQEANWIEDCSFPGTTNNPPKTTASQGTRVQDYLTDCALTVTPDDSILDLQITWDAIHDGMKVKYSDNSTNEIGFRIEKRLFGQSGDWTIVAYRPRQQTTSTNTMDLLQVSFGYSAPLSASFPATMLIDELNPTEWYDFKADPTSIYEYRIATIDCINSNIGANSPLVRVSKPHIADVFSISPNPSSGYFDVRSKGGFEIRKVELLSIDGKMLNSKMGTGSSKMKFLTDITPEGLYILKVYSATGSIFTSKVLIAK